MQVLFHLQSFPRNLTKIEWKEIWRWKRLAVKRCLDADREKIALLQDHRLPKHIKRDLIEELTYPPILVHGKMKL
jgi:hypothetical protein